MEVQGMRGEDYCSEAMRTFGKLQQLEDEIARLGKLLVRKDRELLRCKNL